jgi:NitT/TauT family transport system substrate-binding protein
MLDRAIGILALLVACSCIGQSTKVFAETGELRIARQIGLGFLQLMVMEDKKLLEKHLGAAGLGDVKVEWSVFGNAGAMNDALISGNLDFATAGIPAVLTLWSRTRGTAQEVKGALGVNVMPMLLNTRNPNIASIKDFGPNDKIGLTGVKISAQAMVLQMAAAQVFGDSNFSKLDSLTVTMAHPDAMAALLSGKSEVNSHFASPPFQYLELENPGIRTVLSSADVVGRMNFSVLYSTVKFRDANPKTYAAVLTAFREATDWINQDKRGAVELYLRVSKSKDTVDHTLKLLTDADFTITPHGFTKFSSFMYKVGTLKVKPDSWKDVFFPEVHALPGD